MLTLQFKYMRILQSKFAKANSKNFRKRGSCGHWSAIVVSSRRNAKLVSSHIAVEGHFLRNCWFRCCKCNNTYRFIQPYLYIYIQNFWNGIYLYMYKKKCLDRENLCGNGKQKWHQLLYTLIKKSIIDTGKRSTPA